MTKNFLSLEWEIALLEINSYTGNLNVQYLSLTAGRNHEGKNFFLMMFYDVSVSSCDLLFSPNKQTKNKIFLNHTSHLFILWQKRIVSHSAEEWTAPIVNWIFSQTFLWKNFVRCSIIISNSFLIWGAICIWGGQYDPVGMGQADTLFPGQVLEHFLERQIVSIFGIFSNIFGIPSLLVKVVLQAFFKVMSNSTKIILFIFTYHTTNPKTNSQPIIGLVIFHHIYK